MRTAQHPVIAIVNESTVLADDVIARWVPALQQQLDQDAGPIWRPYEPAFGGTLIFIEKHSTVAIPSRAWVAHIVDNSDQPGALGYHIDDHGIPQTYVFAKTTIDAGLSPSITLSHELLEMAGDPTTRLYNRSGVNLYARELCDPVESDSDGYEISGIKVSNFVTPRWFGAPVGPPNTYDFRGQLSRPFSLRRGGYEIVFDPQRGWHQVFAAGTHTGRPGTSGRSRHRVDLQNFRGRPSGIVPAVDVDAEASILVEAS